MKKYLAAILLLCGVAYAGDRYVLNVVGTQDGKPIVELVPVETPTPTPEPEPDPEPTPNPTPQPSADSPTGYAPRVVWSRERQAIYARMVAENHPLWQHLKSQADAAIAGNPAYGDNGQYCTLAYQFTGDRKYGRRAWEQLLPLLKKLTTGNDVRELFCESVVCLEWLRPVLTDEELSAGLAELDRIALVALSVNTPAYTGGFLVSDSDQTLGQYFGLAAMDRAFGRDYLSRVSEGKDSGGMDIAIGGLDPPGKDTVRDAIKRYADLAAGGVWPESSAYNLGTLTITWLGIEAAGPEHFPEFAALCTQIAAEQFAEITPDLSDCYQWGDCEGRGIGHHLFYRQNLLLMLGENELSAALIAKHKTLPWWRAFWTIDPYKPAKSLPATASVDCPGTGVYLRKAADELLGVTFCSNSGLHHSGTNQQFGDVVLWRGGEWVLDHRVGYQSTNLPECGNCVLLAGLGPMFDRSSRVDGGKIIGETKGPRVAPGTWGAPESFVRLYRRTVERDGTAIVLTDAIDMDDPQTLARFANYPAADYLRIKTAGRDLIQQVFHCPVQPTVEANTVTWRTAKGQTVRITWPDDRDVKVIDESVLWPGNIGLANGQSKQWQVRLVPRGYTGGPIELVTKVEVN